MAFYSTGVETVLDYPLPTKQGKDPSPSDLLLPEHLLAYSLAQKNRFGEWRDLLAYLAGRYRKRILRIANQSSNNRFRYQESGLKLQRICYLPYQRTHLELRMLSYASRISMCALIVMMLEWEKDSRDEIHKTPVVPMNFESAWILTPPILTVFARIQRAPVYMPP